jgi:hypothetical protein
MTNTKRIIFSLLGSLAVTAAVWASPLTSTSGTAHVAAAAAAQQQGQKPKEITGKISSIQKGTPQFPASFTLDVADKTIIFFQHPKTAITGELKVGAPADVSYVLDQDGNNLAVAVKVK